MSRFGTAIARSGIEISLAEGQPVQAIHEGTVAYADQFTGYGDLVIVDHGEGVYSLYGYLASIEATRGQRVEAHTRIGASGRNPSGNPALYFELRVDGKPVDPLQWLKR
jgi:septal ring factor EnvC (AmiA/AmiB activator)